MSDTFTADKFTWLKQVATDAGLSGRSSALAIVIADHLNRGSGEAFPGLDTMASLLGTDRRTVQRLVDGLCQAGHLQKRRGGDGRSNRYRIIISDVTNLSTLNEALCDKSVHSETEAEEQSGHSCRSDVTNLSTDTGHICPPNPLIEPFEEPIEEGDPPTPQPHDEIGEAVSQFNTTAKETGLPQVQNLTAKRRAALKARLSECGGLDGWQSAMTKIRSSAFLRGQKGKGWRADFDFILQQSSFTKLLEGSYDDLPETGNRRLAASQRLVERFGSREQHDFEMKTAQGAHAAPKPAREPLSPPQKTIRYPKLAEAFSDDPQISAVITNLNYPSDDEAARILATRGKPAARSYLQTFCESESKHA